MKAREQAELSLIEAKVKLDLELARVTFQYPIIQSLDRLGDNRAQVTAITAKVEARLEK